MHDKLKCGQRIVKCSGTTGNESLAKSISNLLQRFCSWNSIASLGTCAELRKKEALFSVGSKFKNGGPIAISFESVLNTSENIVLKSNLL